MELKTLLDGVEARIAEGVERAATVKVHGVLASDLMSDVLMVDTDACLLVTSLATDQSVRTAHIIGACGVLVVNGKALSSTMTRLAHEAGLVLAQTKLAKFETCVKLGRLLENGG